MGLRNRALSLSAALACAVALAACGGDDEPSGSGDAIIATAPATQAAAGATVVPTRPAATLPAGATVPAGVADAAFNNFKTQFAAVKSYRMTAQVESQGQRVEMVMDLQLPDRYKVTMTGGPIPIESIGIGNQTYVKVGPVWQVAPGTSTLPFQPNQLATQMQGFANSPNVVKGATLTVAGATCTVYSVTSPQGQKADICIGGDGLPRQVKYTDAASTLTVTYSMFNANFNIVAPI